MVIFMTEEKRKVVFKVFKWLSGVLSAALGALIVISAVVFVPMIFFREHMTVEAGGLLGFFIDVLREGAVPVESGDLLRLVFPRIAALIFTFCFAMKSWVYFRRGEKEKTPFFSGSKQLLVSLSATSLMNAVIPQLLTNVAKSAVESPELFNITETDRTGWLLLAAALFFFSFFAQKGKMKEKATGTDEKTETTEA